MAKNAKNNENKPLFKTKTKQDNSVEVIVTKSPSKTKVGKIVCLIIAALTVLVPLATCVYLLIVAMAK